MHLGNAGEAILVMCWTTSAAEWHFALSLGAVVNNKSQRQPNLVYSMMADCLQAESRGHRMREVEPAHVVALSYVISNDGASDTCARLTLRLSDPESPLQGRTFDVELPPATNGHAEFVIPQHRFLASVHRMWKRGDRCQVLFLLALSCHCCWPHIGSPNGC